MPNKTGPFPRTSPRIEQPNQRQGCVRGLALHSSILAAIECSDDHFAFLHLAAKQRRIFEAMIREQQCVDLPFGKGFPRRKLRPKHPQTGLLITELRGPAYPPSVDVKV